MYRARFGFLLSAYTSCVPTQRLILVSRVDGRPLFQTNVNKILAKRLHANIFLDRLAPNHLYVFFSSCPPAFARVRDLHSDSVKDLFLFHYYIVFDWSYSFLRIQTLFWCALFSKMGPDLILLNLWWTFFLCGIWFQVARYINRLIGIFRATWNVFDVVRLFI